MKILFIEDNPSDARLFREYIAAEFPTIEVEWVSRPMDAHAAGDCQVALLDLNVDAVNFGVATISNFRKAFPHLPIVVLTGIVATPEFVQCCMEAGADAFFNKAGITNMRRVVEAIKEAFENFQRQSTEDDKRSQAQTVITAVSQAHKEAEELLRMHRKAK